MRSFGDSMKGIRKTALYFLLIVLTLQLLPVLALGNQTLFLQVKAGYPAGATERRLTLLAPRVQGQIIRSWSRLAICLA